MKQKLLIGALIVVGLASIAYAAFSQSLVINGTGTTNADWDVRITGITQVNAEGATDVNGSPTFTATTATFDVELAYPGASATYDVTVTNAGSIDAVLDSLTDLTTVNGQAPTDITFTVSGVTAGTTALAAGATNTVTVEVEWDPASTLATQESKTASITLNYVQDM